MKYSKGVTPIEIDEIEFGSPYQILTREEWQNAKAKIVQQEHWLKRCGNIKTRWELAKLKQSIIKQWFPQPKPRVYSRWTVSDTREELLQLKHKVLQSYWAQQQTSVNVSAR